MFSALHIRYDVRMDNAANLLSAVRRAHKLDQQTLARRASTSQAQISRIERGKTSPSVSTLQRLLRAMGEQLAISSTPSPHGNISADDLRRQLGQTSTGERVAEAIELSRLLTGIAASRARHG
jgi:transcriptional regulator with XRE-family HTH domain